MDNSNNHTSLIPSIFLNACVSIVLALINRLSALRREENRVLSEGHKRVPTQIRLVKAGLVFACVSIVLGFSVVIVTFYRSENGVTIYMFSSSMVCIILASVLLIIEQLLAEETDPSVIESFHVAASV